MKLNLTIFSLFFLCSNLFGQHHDIQINGIWKFLPDSSKNQSISGYENGLPAIARMVSVPHTWNIEPGLENFHGTAWYQKEFDAAADWKGKAIYLKFGAVYHDATVFINGKKVGEHLNAGFTAFNFNVSGFLLYGTKNKIVVCVNSMMSDQNLPYKDSFDWTNDGGIIRGVNLHISDKPSIQYVHITPKLNLADSSGTVSIAIKLNETELKKATFVISCKERKTGKMVYSTTITLKKETKGFCTNISLKKITPWHFDQPFLYELTVESKNKNTVADAKTEKFGFRELKIKGEKLYLNGECVRLPGLEYMPASHPAYGVAEPHEFLDSVVRKMKDLNVTITRFHWPQDEYILDLMDEYGILAQEELPWWQKPNKLSPHLMQVAKSQLSEMINDHYNHPCLFAWGISNEVSGASKENHLELKSYIQQLDTSRSINIVGNKIFKNLQKDPPLWGDIPTWNEYIGTWHGKNRKELPGMFQNIDSILNNRPLLITEHGLCEPVFTGGDARRIDEMLFHTTEWCSQPFVIGFIYFCLNDYRTQMGEEGIGRYKIRRHGLTDLFLKPKASYQVFKQICSPVEIYKVQKLNDTDATIGIKVKNSIPSYVLRNYTLKFKSISGTTEEIRIPNLYPGEKKDIVLKNINERYSFEICRPNGFMVIDY